MKNIMRNNKLLSIIVSAALAALCCIGCGKEEEPIVPVVPDSTDNPFTPTESNNYTYGGDSLSLATAALTNYQGTYTYTFTADDYHGIDIIVPTPSEGTFELTGNTSAMLIDGYDYLPIQGVYHCRRVGENYEFILDGTCQGKVLRMYYYGPLYDLSTPCGEGNLNIDGRSLQLDVHYSHNLVDIYEYVIADTMGNLAVSIYTLKHLEDKTYAITSDESRLETEDAVILYIEVENSGRTIMGTAVSGTLSIQHAGNDYDITFSGQLFDEVGERIIPFNGTYRGQRIDF